MTATETTPTTTCNACGLPSTEDFCFRPECLTYGSGACAPGPSIVNLSATPSYHLVVRHPTLEAARAAEARLAARHPRSRFAVTSDPSVPICPFAVVADGPIL